MELRRENKLYIEQKLPRYEVGYEENNKKDDTIRFLGFLSR